jgi:formamidopyrimidine-DNA glycosylase
MPELPEVETVRKGLADILRDQPVIRHVQLNRPDIRFAIPKDLPQKLVGEVVTGVRRRAKYLMIDTKNYILLSHLGMTGSWRLLVPGEEDRHDHCYIDFEDGRRLAFRDPRRFGLIDLLTPAEEAGHVRMRGLGPEPLDAAAFSPDYLFRASRQRKTALKVFIMDQRVVVGVGNIYASEALFRAKIRPQRLAGRITLAEATRLTSCIQLLLGEAIAAGGSSIRDYQSATGESGAFQDAHQVYGRQGQPCYLCHTPIRAQVLGGRSTFWCPRCQRQGSVS